MMARLPGFSDEAWRVIQGAKAAAMSEGRAEISIRHVFQGFVLEEPGAVREALASLGVAKDEIETYVSVLRPNDSLPAASTALLALSARVELVIQRARQLAMEYPSGSETPIAPIHLWSSLCVGVSELMEWLKDCGWRQEHINELPRIAREQLEGVFPKSQRPPMLTPKALEVLNNFCDRNLTELARQGVLKPAYCMEHVTQQIIRCLLKKGRRNVILTGTAGVGKTKLAEDLAVRIVNGEIPELQDCQVFSFDLTLFTSGTHLAGSRTERWKQLREVLKAHPEGIILFIDELHSVVGLNLDGQALDLANALKPLLGEGRVRVMGTTTHEEYRRYIQGDPALERRFTEVKVPEPDKDSVLRILREVSPEYEEAHGVTYSPESLEAIYSLARTYLPNQAFPAKAIELLDEVGVDVKMRHRTQRPEGRMPVVGEEGVKEVMCRIWGLAPETLSVDLAGLLKEQVVGQDHAIQELADIIITSARRYGKERRKGPRAVILFIGPPGIGKSYTAQCLAEVLFPGQNRMLAIDMTEFGGYHEAEHARFRLLGAPPPYVGWETGGLLTNHAMRNPVSIVLVDEFEKAGATARNVLLRVFDEGWAQDGRGRVVSFLEMYFILTANAGHMLWETMK